MKFLTKKYFILLTAVSLLFSCAGSVGNGGSSGQKNPQDSTKKISNADKSLLVKVNNRLFSVPSPLQLAVILKKMKLPYKKELLNPVSARQDYTTTFKQALNTGVYGADLAYINVYGQLPEAPSYFGAVKSLTSELGILNSFSEQIMERIERNSGDKDSLMYIASTIYRESDYYLINSDRNEVGALIIAGGWVEALYLLTNAANSNSETSPEVIEIIGQQKYPLNNLIELLRPYYGKLNRGYDSFLENLSDLANIFDEVNIKYTYKPAQTDENKKLTIINSESKAVLDKSLIDIIREKITKLRGDIIQ